MSGNLSYFDEDEVPQLFERQPIVLHLGSRFCRLGFSGVHLPLKVVSAPLLDENQPPAFPLLRPEAQANISEKAASEAPSRAWELEGLNRKDGRKFERVACETLPSPALLGHRLGEWLQHILGGTFGVNAGGGDSVVVIAEGPFLHPEIKATLIRLLLEHFQVSGVAIISDLVAPLYSCGVQTGLVVDVGPLICALRVSNGGAAAVLMQLQKEMLETAETPEQRRKLEDIAVKVLYVQYKIEAGDGGQGFLFNSQKDALYRLEDGSPLLVSAETRWRCAEMLFDGVSPREAACDTGDGIVSLIISSLHATPRDARRLVIQNVLVCGGFASLRGFTTRLAVELNSALTNDSRLKGLAESAAFGVPPAGPPVRQWVGASLHSMLQGKQVYTQVDLQEGKPLPDWSSVAAHEAFLPDGLEGGEGQETWASYQPSPEEALKVESQTSRVAARLSAESRSEEVQKRASSSERGDETLHAKGVSSSDSAETEKAASPRGDVALQEERPSPSVVPLCKTHPVVPRLDLSSATRSFPTPKPKPKPPPPPLPRKAPLSASAEKPETETEREGQQQRAVETLGPKRLEEEESR